MKSLLYKRVFLNVYKNIHIYYLIIDMSSITIEFARVKEYMELQKTEMHDDETFI
jgi:hypothetical protein